MRQRLISAGVRIPGNGNGPKPLDAERVKRLYVVEGKTREEIAKLLRPRRDTVSATLKASGVTQRYQGAWRRKYPKFAGLKVGESIIAPKPAGGGRWQMRFYNSARLSGIRVSVRQIDDSTVRITRIEDQPEKPRRPSIRRPDIVTDDLRRMYEEGLTLNQIAEKVGIARTSVTARLKKADVVMKVPGGQKKAFDAELVKRLYLEEKLTVAQIAKRLRSARRTVANFLKENGVALRGTRRK